MADYRRMTFLPSSLEMDSADDTKGNKLKDVITDRKATYSSDDNMVVGTLLLITCKAF